jgi:hypothetical protein
MAEKQKSKGPKHQRESGRKTVKIPHLILLTLILCMSTPAIAGNFGLGIIVGEPTGLSFKAWTGNTAAIDGGAAWSLGENYTFHLHVDYLLHNFELISVEKGRLPLYYGIGGRIKLRDEDRRGDDDDHIGIRIPVGLEYLFERTPLDIFIEIVPILDLAPDTDLDFNGAIGIRYWF